HPVLGDRPVEPLGETGLCGLGVAAVEHDETFPLVALSGPDEREQLPRVQPEFRPVIPRIAFLPAALEHLRDDRVPERPLVMHRTHRLPRFVAIENLDGQVPERLAVQPPPSWPVHGDGRAFVTCELPYV